MIAWGPWSDAPAGLCALLRPHLIDPARALAVQRLPVIGQSFTHSAFEAVQQAAIQAAGLPLAIERWEKKPHLLPDVIAQLRAGDFAGALVEAPHKEKVATLVDALSDDARSAGAVNLIVRDGERLRGHNTDVDGVRAGLRSLMSADETAWPPGAVLLGAGGGARAVVTVLLGSGVQHVCGLQPASASGRGGGGPLRAQRPQDWSSAPVPGTRRSWRPTCRRRSWW